MSSYKTRATLPISPENVYPNFYRVRLGPAQDNFQVCRTWFRSIYAHHEVRRHCIAGHGLVGRGPEPRRSAQLLAWLPQRRCETGHDVLSDGFVLHLQQVRCHPGRRCGLYSQRLRPGRRSQYVYTCCHAMDSWLTDTCHPDQVLPATQKLCANAGSGSNTDTSAPTPTKRPGQTATVAPVPPPATTVEPVSPPPTVTGGATGFAPMGGLAMLAVAALAL